MLLDEFAHLFFVSLLGLLSTLKVRFFLFRSKFSPIFSHYLSDSGANDFSMLVGHLSLIILVKHEKAGDWFFGFVLQLILFLFV